MYGIFRYSRPHTHSPQADGGGCLYLFSRSVPSAFPWRERPPEQFPCCQPLSAAQFVWAAVMNLHRVCVINGVTRIHAEIAKLSPDNSASFRGSGAAVSIRRPGSHPCPSRGAPLCRRDAVSYILGESDGLTLIIYIRVQRMRAPLRPPVCVGRRVAKNSVHAYKRVRGNRD